MSHISVYARFNLKKSKRLGLTSEDWTFAKDEPLSYDVLMACIAAKLAEFYLNTSNMSIDEMNKLVEKAAEQIKTIRFSELEN